MIRFNKVINNPRPRYVRARYGAIKSADEKLNDAIFKLRGLYNPVRMLMVRVNCLTGCLVKLSCRAFGGHSGSAFADEAKLSKRKIGNALLLLKETTTKKKVL
jgi:hypothetical protein